MGVVYLALDPRLKRHVAIKALPSRYANDPEWHARLQQEAEVLGRLNHPHIALIYERLDVDGEGSYLILEYVDGRNLRQILREGPLRLPQALELSAQIATALEAAHHRGIIHRDIKPENIQVTDEFSAKVLDFGIATPVTTTISEPVSGDTTIRISLASTSDPPDSPRGAGTPGYMSPEQARGRPVDRRTDIFAFGCVLFECLTGRPAFDGLSVQDRIAAVYENDPDWSLPPRDTPESIRDLIRHCLEKNLVDRLRDIGDARWTIETALGKRATPARPKVETPVPHNLPPTLVSFVGRQEIIDRLCATMRECRLLSVVGVGGCGKTSVALQVAARLLSDHAAGVWFVDLAGTDDAGRALETVVTVLGAGSRGHHCEIEGLRQKFGESEALLVLDGCEHLLPGLAPAIDQLLRACSRLRILATTREVLGLAAEQVYFMPSLKLPGDAAGESEEELLQNEAVRLFIERARLVRPGFDPKGASLAAIASICQRLDGIPLAIELAAARIRMLTPQQITSKLDNRFQLLTGGGITTPPRHRTLRATLEWSFRLLSEEDRRALHSLEVFSSGWSLEAASAVFEADELVALDLLTRLLDKSLIVTDPPADSQATPSDVRYRLHETIREYLREQRTENTDPQVQAELQKLWWNACLAHVRYYAALAKRVADGIKNAPSDALRAIVLKERDNFLSAQRFALETLDDLQWTITEDLRFIWKCVFVTPKPGNEGTSLPDLPNSGS
jgi:non-specific serine/threonine protein kinase